MVSTIAFVSGADGTGLLANDVRIQLWLYAAAALAKSASAFVDTTLIAVKIATRNLMFSDCDGRRGCCRSQPTE